MSFRQKDHWGTYLWGFIHTISIVDMEHNLDYNKSALAQLKGLVNSIPCEKCKMHYKQDLEILDRLDFLTYFKFLNRLKHSKASISSRVEILDYLLEPFISLSLKKSSNKLF